MIAYLPEIYPDELVYSWFCRYYVHSGCITYKAALGDILLKRCNNPSKEFIGHLNPEAAERIGNMYSMRELVLDHTMYPEYARFIPAERKQKALDSLAFDFCDAHTLFAVPPRGEGDRYMKYCPVCADEDRKRYGETYWHRTHQLRSIRVCPVHACYLISSEITAKSENTFTLCPAERYAADKHVQPVSTPQETS